MGFKVFLDKFESFVGVNFWTMIFAWINLLILYIILKKILFKPVKNMIDSRQKEIDDMYGDAESARAEATRMKTDYEARLEAANGESEEILKRAVRKAQLREEEILKAADEEARRALARAAEEAELEKKKLLNDVKDEVSDLALGIAAAVIERDVSAEEHRELIDRFIDEMGEEDDADR